MEELLKKYSEKATIGLRKINDSEAKSFLEELIKFTMYRA
jgi:geranylgeranyl pyrophosphate synthase